VGLHELAQSLSAVDIKEAIIRSASKLSPELRWRVWIWAR